jgi:glucose/arabinose dehydrogenase
MKKIALRPRFLSRLVAVGLFIALTPLIASAAPTGLVAAYGFNEGTGTTVADASGNGNTGTISGATWTASGKYGSALSFNGSGARVTVNDSASLHLTTGMTIEAWVYPTTTSGGWRDVVYKFNDVYYLDTLRQKAAFGGVGGTIYAPSALQVNTWSHLAATYDGVTKRLYVNGVQVASQPQTGLIQTSTGALGIGGDAAYGQYWAGRIDEVRIYNRPLSASEIQSDMSTPVGAPANQPPVAAASASPTSGVAPLAVAFSSAGSSDPEGAALSYSWVFGDGATSTAANPTHTYSAAGAYVARLTVSDGVNSTTSGPVSITVNGSSAGFVNEVVVPDITSATTLAFLPDGRMLVGELTGTIWVVQPGASQPDPDPFLQLDYSQLVGEQGLMDIALDPNFAQYGYYYVFYTRGFPSSQNHNRVSRFTASGNTTVPDSEVVLWQDDKVAQFEHHGGALAFGPDGKLYISSGDQFRDYDPQSLDNYQGKILRINSDGSIPTDNPFYDGAGPNKDEIWAYGLRNPFRMSFDRVTGKLYIGDVGGNGGTAIEEVYLGVRGANYGWPYREVGGGPGGITPPIHSYSHAGRDACVIGGFVYRGSQFPSEYYGSYFFGDYVQNWIKRLTFDANGNVTGVFNFEPPDGSPDGPTGDPVKLVEGPDGALYYVDIGFNDLHTPNPAAIRRIRYVSGNLPPVAVASANPGSGPAPLTVAFSSAGSTDPEGAPLSYSWAFGDGSTSTAANPTHTYQAAGPYVARLTVSDGVNTALSNDVSIAVGNPPSATILAPADGSFFRAGDVITFTGSGTDPEDGDLPASAFSWTIVFHHEGHIHPGAGPITNTKSGTFAIPLSGHDFSGNTGYEISLTVTDSTGLKSTASVFIFPAKVNLTFDTNPSGLLVEINGQSRQTPFILDDAINFQDTINAPNQIANNTSYAFVSWSDGGAQSHGIVVPTVDQSYVATFAATGVVGLVAAYGFNEGTGTRVTDASGNGNTGTISGATWTTSGKYGKALSFNGSGAVVTVNDAPSLDLTTGMTLMAWVYPTTTSGGWRDVIYKYNDVYYLDTLSGTLAVGGPSGTTVYGTGALPVNTWSHVAATYDGATMRLYVNGVQVASQSQTGNLSTSANQLQIGGDSFYGQYFQGIIDEVRIYNIALSQGRILTDMNTPLP